MMCSGGAGKGDWRLGLAVSSRLGSYESGAAVRGIVCVSLFR